MRVDVVEIGWNERLARFRCERHHLYVGGEVCPQRVGQATRMLRHVLRSDGEGVGEALALDELDAVFVLATLEQNALEELLDAVDRLEAIEVDWPAGPLAGEPHVPPGADVRVAEPPSL